MPELITPPVATPLSEDALAEQLHRWSRLQGWTEAAWFARELGERSPRDVSRLREAALACERAGDADGCTRMLSRLARNGPLDTGEKLLWVRALVRLGAHTQAARELQRAALGAADGWDALLAVASLWWELAPHAVDGVERRDRDERGWRAACALVEVADGEERGRQLLSLLWEHRIGSDGRAAPGRTSTCAATVKRLADRLPVCRTAAAYFLAEEQPDWTLGTLKDLALEQLDNEAVQARLQAHLALQEHTAAARDFDRLSEIWDSMRAFPADTALRYQWVRTLVEVGRLIEAQEECRCALDEVVGQERRLREAIAAAERERVRNGESGGVPDEHPARQQWVQTRWLHCYYAVDLGRIHYLRGRYDLAWPAFRRAAELDDERLNSATRSILAYVGLVTAADERAAADRLSALERLSAGSTAPALPMLDTLHIEGCLWAAGRWESADGTWRSPGGGDRFTAEREVLEFARARGLVMARELWHRSHGAGVAQRMRVALLAGDELKAKALSEQLPAPVGDRWAGRVLRAVLHLQLGEDGTALDLLRAVMSERRFDVDLRVLYAHAALLAGQVEEAAQESHEIVEMVPEHTMARVVRAECRFELALRRETLTPTSTKKGDAATANAEAVAMENVQQLIMAVADYQHAVVLDARTKSFMSSRRPDSPVPLGSDMLTPRQVVQVCRRGLHAAIIAQEGLDRLGLTRDGELERHAQLLLSRMRGHDPVHPCATCLDAHAQPVPSRLHRLRHRRDRDEAVRLAHLLTGYRRASRRRVLQLGGTLGLGLVVVAVTLFEWGWVTRNVPGIEVATVRATLLAFGLLLTVTPFVRSIKFGNFELQRPERAPPIAGRSKALRASTVLQRNALLSTMTSLMPSVSARIEGGAGHTGATRPDVEPDREPGQEGAEAQGSPSGGERGGKPSGKPSAKSSGKPSATVDG